MIDELRWRRAVLRHEASQRTDEALFWLAARLPHRFVYWVLAHVASATIRPDENVTQTRWIDVVGRWERRELRGHAADRHRRPA